MNIANGIEALIGSTPTVSLSRLTAALGLDGRLLAKLEAQNPIYVRNATEGLLSKLDELFGADAMPICKAYLHKLQYSL